MPCGAWRRGGRVPPESERPGASSCPGGRATRRAAGEAIVFEAAGEQELKGLAVPLEVFALVD